MFFSTDGTGALIIFAQQMAQALLAGADDFGKVIPSPARAHDSPPV